MSKTEAVASAIVTEPRSSLKTSRIAVLGAGKLGEALISGLLGSNSVNADQLSATTAHRERSELLADKFQMRTTTVNRQAVEGADVILIAVKPKSVADVLSDIRETLTENQVVISVAASVPTAYIESVLRKKVPVIRTMPNTPCLLRRGMTAIAPGLHARAEHLELAQDIFKCLGRTVVLEEKYMDAVTGLSASGPAYIYIIIESLAEGGVKMGLPRDVAIQLAAQTVFGASSMVLETGEHPALLKDSVTTPAGCTIDGILELEEGGLRVTLIKAVVKATQRAKELLHG